MGDVADLTAQLKQRDDVINMMKTKTKEFVFKLKEEHGVAMVEKDKAIAEAGEVRRTTCRPNTSFMHNIVQYIPYTQSF